MSRFLVFAVLTASALADFNNTQCPGHWEVSSQHVVEEFDMNKFVGTYYEQALHDITQYPTCPKLSCIRSVKTWTETLGGDFQISDTFSIECFGTTYTNEYYFNTTDDNGYLVGFLDDPPAIWKIYPDTIVEFKESADGGQYEWVVEFQCTDSDDGESVRFTGFNFYSREQNPSAETVNEMIQAARDAGLSIYMDAWPGVYNVTQTGCAYDEAAEDGASRQGHLRG